MLFRSAETSADSAGGPQDWWKIVTASMLRRAPGTIAEFIEGIGAALPFDIEGFARALALQQLFEGGDVVGKAATKAYLLLTFDPNDFAGGLVKAEAWLPRGAAIEAGLLRSLELLRPQVDGGLAAAVDSFGVAFCTFETSCISAVVHAGLREPMVVKRHSWRWRSV